MKTIQKSTTGKSTRVKEKNQTGESRKIPDRIKDQKKRRQVTVKPFEEPLSQVILNVPRLTLEKLGMTEKK